VKFVIEMGPKEMAVEIWVGLTPFRIESNGGLL
jgi:hypothetical protein